MNEEHGQLNESRRKMYHKNTSSQIFTPNEKEFIAKVTPKVTDRKIYDPTFTPKYIEKNAREQYMQQFWKKTPTKIIKPDKPIKLNNNLNATEMKCRDMYSDCDVKQYRLRRSKSFFIPRSGIINLNDKEEMSSRKRMNDHMSSNIFFADTNSSNGNDNHKQKDTNGQLTATPFSKVKSMNFRGQIMENNPQKIVPKYCNTEARTLKRSATVGPKKKTFKRINMCARDINNDLQEQKIAIAATGYKTNMTNVESVDYDILSQKTSAGYNTPSSHTRYTSFLTESKISLKTPVKQIDDYEIKVPKGFNKLNVREVKNFFVSEGMHIFNFEEKQNCLDGDSGKMTFKIRRNDNDKNFDSKMGKILQKVEKKQMVLKQIPIAKRKAPLSITIGNDDSSILSTPVVKGHIKRQSVNTSPSKILNNFKMKLLKSEKQQYDQKYKNQHLPNKK